MRLGRLNGDWFAQMPVYQRSESAAPKALTEEPESPKVPAISNSIPPCEILRTGTDHQAVGSQGVNQMKTD